MKEIKLTEQQKAAVENRGGNLLVSAAAGAGKTQVLVDRITSMVANEGQDINKFLVITYTRDAAAQLRAKITSKLSSLLADAPDNKHLQTQVRSVYAAQISTVHAFCSSLLHDHAAEAGLTTDFRVGEETECQTMRADAMEDVMESVYANIEDTPDMKAFLSLTVGRDDAAVKAILHRVYDTIQAHPWPGKWANACVAAMSCAGIEDAAETPWGAFILDDIRKYAESQIPAAKEAQVLCDTDKALSVAYGDAFSADISVLKAISVLDSWDGLYGMQSPAWSRLKPIKKGVEYDVSVQEKVKALRDRYKSGIKTKMTAVIGPSSEVMKDLAATELSVAGMFHIVELFTKRYTEKKQAHNVLDYSDLEHYTISLLVDEKTGEKTEVAKAISKRFTAIMVDEYQDTNAVQETIFDAISNGENRFMVGDMKQSIYAFRLADPTIFLSHYRTYKPYSSAKAGEARKVVLTKNFRSRPEILEATNAVMRTCMSRQVGGIEYSDDEALEAGRTDFPDTSSPAVELVTIDMAGSEDSTDEDGASLAKVDVEAQYVARRIQKMLEEETILDETTGALRPVRPGDIAIIMRAAKNSARHYVKALTDAGIPTKSMKTGSLLDTDEIQVMYSFLQVIDNPYQDVPLVAVLASPLFGFTAEDLAKAKISCKSATSFYEAIQSYAEISEKAAAFLVSLSRLRERVPYTRMTKLYFDILNEVQAFAVFGSYDNGAQREANLFAFGSAISDYEANGARSLFQFLQYIESLKEQGVELPQPAVSGESDAVTITSTHASKGLEYPIVFLADLSRRFNQSNLQDSVLLDKDLGAGVQVYDPDLDYRYPTIARNAIAVKSVVDSKAEELRILYVAMTRAKQKLVMTYCDNLKKTVTRLADEATSPMPVSEVLSVSCPGQWVLQTALCMPEAWPLYKAVSTIPHSCMDMGENAWGIHYVSAQDVHGGERRTMEELEALAEMEIDAEETIHKADLPFPAPDTNKMQENVSFVYPYMAATITPATASPTGTMHRVAPTIKMEPHTRGEEKRRISATERGTAIHAFMQFADYKKCALTGPQAEVDRLTEQGFLLSEEEDALDMEMLRTFFKSSASERLAALPTSNIHREFRFSTLVPANEILDGTGSTDAVLVSGIVDLFYVDSQGIHIFDFKSDYVPDEAAKAEKVAAYSHQINAYAKALESIYDLPVKEKVLMFLRTGDEVSIKATA